MPAHNEQFHERRPNRKRHNRKSTGRFIEKPVIKRNANIDVTVREIRNDELGILEDVLYEAVYRPPGTKPLPRAIIKIPEIYICIENFGSKKDDYCLVAETENKITGAVWIRILDGPVKGFGNIDDRTPEFGIALFEEYRNLGIGTRMMKEMIKYMKQKGYEKTSLSVNKDNYAVKMYLKTGFEIIEENKDDYLMLSELNPKNENDNSKRK